MDSAMILKMIDNGEIEALKGKLKDDIYKKSLNGKSGAKERYRAMQRFVKYNNYHKFESRKGIVKPKNVNGKYYFTNGHCLVETTEGIGGIREFNEKQDGDYVDVVSVLKEANSGESTKIDIQAILSKAKAEGYKFNSKLLSGTGFNNLKEKFLIKFNDTYINVALLDYAFSIINDGKPAEVVYVSQFGGVWITTSVGRAMVLPIRYNENNKNTGEIIIDAMEETIQNIA